MPQPSLLGYPLSTLVLYFCFYAFAGWCMETVYCSVLEKRFVPRGFLYGPICPIYGVGVLLMILFFQPLAGNILVFYLVSTVTMSAWEYFVGWFLEVTTHMKYWDYSMYRFNLKGRICLWVCLVWGALSYVCVFWVHPPVAALIARIPPLARDVAAIILAAAVLTDAVATIRELALMTTAMDKLQKMGEELQLQMALGRMELSDKLSDAKESVTGRLQDAKEAMAAALPDTVVDSGAKLHARYNDLVAAAERRTRRFRRNYIHFNAPKLDVSLRRAMADKGRQVLEERRAKKAAKAKKKAAK